MKHIDWSKWLLPCSGIDPVFTFPKGVTPLTEKNIASLAKLRLKEEKTQKELDTIAHYEKKASIYANPPLAKTAIQYLTERYSWEKYAKKTASTGRGLSFLEKGYTLEGDAIKMLSKLDKQHYVKNDELVRNEFILGRCDIISEERGVVIDVKTSWNINTFMKVRNYPLNSKYWFQAQGYMEIHDVEFAEICFVLLNTPEDLVSRERTKLLNRFVSGEIDREVYEKNCENLAGALAYNNIPLKKRVIRFGVERDRTLMPILYEKVNKGRGWLAQFDALHEANKQIISLRENYVKAKPEDNTECDTSESLQGDTG